MSLKGRDHKLFAGPLHRVDDLEPGHFIDGADVIEPGALRQITLVDTVDADIAGFAIGFGFAPFTNAVFD